SIVLLVPGTGDEVQTIKAGIMEIGDIFVVNKSDRDGAEHVVQSIMASLALQPFAEGEWRPPVLKTEAATGAGVDRLWEEIARFRQHAPHQQAPRRKASHESRLRGLVAQRLLEHVEKRLPEGEFARSVEAVAARQTDPYSAAASLVSRALGA